MSSRADVLVLVGPKGAGKTTIGHMLERVAGTRFLEVERIAKRVLKATGGQVDEAYARRAFEEIAAQVKAISPQHRTVIIETTGASTETPSFIASLRRDHVVKLVRVYASAETCMRRISDRDPARQVVVPAQLIRSMHARTEALDLDWDAELDNDSPLSEEQVMRALEPLLR